METLIRYLKKVSKKNSLWASFLHFAYHFCTHPLIKVIALIIFAFCISLLMKMGNFHLNKPILVQVLTYKKLMCVLIGYLGFSISLGVCEEYRKILFNDILLRNDINNFFISNTNKRITDLFAFYNNVVETADRDYFVYRFLEYADFQENAKKACEKLYNFIKTHLASNDHQVTLLLKTYDIVQETEKQIVKMIAYGTKHGDCPSSFDEKYELITEGYNQNDVFFHQKLFQEESRNISILKNQKEINAKFKINPRSEKRETILEQYIGMPLVLPGATGEMFGLLQIDTPTPSLFGKECEEIEDFAKNHFMPFQITIVLDYLRFLSARHMFTCVIANDTEENVADKNIDSAKVETTL